MAKTDEGADAKTLEPDAPAFTKESITLTELGQLRIDRVRWKMQSFKERISAAQLTLKLARRDYEEAHDDLVATAQDLGIDIARDWEINEEGRVIYKSPPTPDTNGADGAPAIPIIEPPPGDRLDDRC